MFVVGHRLIIRRAQVDETCVEGSFIGMNLSAQLFVTLCATLTGGLHSPLVPGLTLPSIVRERRRLASRKERERLARSLEHALEEAWHWSPPLSSRALPGVVCLRHATPEARAVIRCLRSERVSVRGVAMTARLLMDGLRSPLYSGDRLRLREELGRIRFALEWAPEHTLA